MVLIPKRDVTYRLYVDYRPPNDITIDDSYLMTRINEILHSTKITPDVSSIACNLDLVRFPSEDRAKTCVVTSFGTYRFTQMSFGLKNAPIPRGYRWILVCTDQATKWTEVFPLVHATAEECAKTLIGEIFLRYDTYRKSLSDNGVHFVSAILVQNEHNTWYDYLLSIRFALNSIFTIATGYRVIELWR